MKKIMFTFLLLISFSSSAFSLATINDDDQQESYNPYNSAQDILKRALPKRSDTFCSDGTSSTTVRDGNGNYFTMNSDGSTSNIYRNY